MWLTSVTVWLFCREGVAKSPCRCGSVFEIYIKLGPNPRDIFQTGKNIYEMHENRVNILPKNSKLFCIQNPHKAKKDTLDLTF